MDKQIIYQQLKELEKELVESFAHFRMVFNKVADPRKQLSNQEIYDKIHGNYKEYHEEVEEIKRRTIKIMKRIQIEHDEVQYHKILSNLGVKPKNAESSASTRSIS
ncbi:hypothetical protein KKE48_05280 [Patescibacteria group bacterium]|nr:hypothetical protein [Patescibacteria group bacterium]MBU1500250.1 hypothetical protein [Patescibacteria group bacterium]MBU2458798.1 hypothetical protein [Nanoarchaeota archaeon]